LDIRHRLPGHFGRFGGIVAVDADRVVTELLISHPPQRTSDIPCHKAESDKKFMHPAGITPEIAQGWHSGSNRQLC
jgi:hypothetical protein